ncbi:hypothetical protein JGU66_04235 [Myxococcaceae bacterium JPH2]|nr:hypothetical protein [Myxococcaceae bacterium JPH2]
MSAKQAKPVPQESSSTGASKSFGALISQFADDPRVQAPQPSRRAFGSTALKVEGRIFAMLVKERLVVKLPKARVEAMLGAGKGEAFTAGGGRVMKEWVVVVSPARSWPALAREALDFVAGEEA